MSSYGVVVVGTGFIGPVHVEGLRRAGQRVLGLVGSSAEKSRRAADALGLETAYADLAAALADQRVDAVHITSPNRWHFEQTRQALAAGKHVMCEKPLATTPRETAELVALAKKTQVAAGVAYNVRFYPLCHEARDRVRRGGVGQVFHVGGSYVQDWLLKPSDFNWRVQADEAGELRAVADIGTHWLDLVQFITGEHVTAVCADLHTVHPFRQRPVGGQETFSGKLSAAANTLPIEIDTEDCGSILLRFAGGGRGCVWVSQVTAGRKNCLRFEIAGSRQSLAWDSERPNELWIGERDAANQSLPKDPALLGDAARAITSYPGGHNEGFPDTFKQLFRTFYGHIAAGDWTAPCPFPTFADGHREVLLCEAILTSHRQRRWIEISEASL